MNRVSALAVAGLLAAAILAPATVSAADNYNMRSGHAVKMDRSAGDLSELSAIAIEPATPAQPTREVPNMLVPLRLQGVPDVDAPDVLPALSPIAGQAPALGLSFGGYDNSDNSTLLGVQIMPPDTEGDIGLGHYVQWNNLGFKIFDRAGNLLNGPNGSAGNLPWAGFGGTCETENDGDPIVLYDHVAGRWLFSQFEIGPGLQCVAISDGENPAGPYTRYAFPISIAGFNDYPKIGLWVSADGTQSAYHVTTNEFAGPFAGVNLTALDRDEMLAGNPAGFVQFTIPPAAGDDPFAFSLQAGHLEGPVLPPAGTCETYIQAFDSETWGAAGGTDGYRTWEFCVDFDTPANSTLTENALIDAGFEFDANLCNFASCVPQPNGQALDTLSQFTMYRFAVRDVGGSLSGVVSHSVDLGGDLAGVQWAQFDMSGVAPVLSDIGQLNVGDTFHRWMPSISQDQDGNIAIGYSRSGSGPSDFPSVYYTGRLASDPPGSLQAEALCVAGTGSQSGGDRWGDYSTVSIDPLDDCTFWVTNEYVETTGSFEWDTQVCTFKFPDCVAAACVPNEPVEETCNDLVDNDCDGDFDCDDSDCADDFFCTCEPEPEICDDGIDNDCDGFTDCDDSDCFADPVCLPPPPENDLCDDAIPLECGETVSGTTIHATLDDAGFCGTSNTAPGVWYSVQHAGKLIASTCNQADYDTKLSVYGGICDELECVGGRDDTPGCAGFTTELAWPSSGAEQLLLVHGFSDQTGNFDLTLSCEDLAPGDICQDAGGPLFAGDIVSGTTTDATVDEPPDIDCGTSVTAPGTWYTVIGTGNTMTASTCNDGDPSTGGANYDTKISVYCADCEVKECIGGQDDDFVNCSGFTTSFDWPTQEGATYNVLVHGFSSATGDFDLAILDDGVPYEGPINDCDGVPEGLDFCPGTATPESVPTSGDLRPNMSALTGNAGYGVFETAPPNPQGVVYTTQDTAGCSCEQIVDILDLGKGHLKNGCSFSAMDDWLMFLDEASCGDCVIANGTPGCENGECEAAVCAVDPFCCDFFWDSICAGEAIDICAGDICIPTPGALDTAPAPVEGGRAWVPEPVTKDPNFTPKE
jgi:hypothetical protein